MDFNEVSEKLGNNFIKIEVKFQISSYPQWLYEKYSVDKLSTTEIANELDGYISRNTVLSHLKALGVERRSQGEARKQVFINNPEYRERVAKHLNSFKDDPEWRENQKRAASEASSGENNYFYGLKVYGEDHWNYDPTISDEERVIKRDYPEYQFWRTEVFERDDYTCRICTQVGYNLTAHHINGYHWDIENRLNIDNGVTLCENCHRDYHKIYGKNYANEEDWLEYYMLQLQEI